MKKFLLPSIAFFAALMAFSPAKKDKAVQTYVVISTEYGEIKALLYDETPLHRDNFVKNVQGGVYDSLLFHRVIKSFMIQGGDPDSKNAKQGEVLGNGGLDYTVTAEIKKELFHKKGALCAARQGDDVNPLKASSSTQFYIVQGQVYTEEMMKKMEARVNNMTQNAIFFELLGKPEYADQKKKFEELKATGDKNGLNTLYLEMMEDIKKVQNERGGEFKFTEKQKEVYMSAGGAAHLDGNYTVFGEVVSGMDVVDKIAEESVDGNSRPLKDIRFSIKIVYE